MPSFLKTFMTYIVAMILLFITYHFSNSGLVTFLVLVNIVALAFVYSCVTDVIQTVNRLQQKNTEDADGMLRLAKNLRVVAQTCMRHEEELASQKVTKKTKVAV